MDSAGKVINNLGLEHTANSTTSSDQYRCDKCQDRGFIVEQRQNKHGISYDVAVPCECRAMRQAERVITKSGLAEQLKKYSLSNWRAETKTQDACLASAQAFLGTKNNSQWFYMGGQSGAGKTHLCASICGELLNRSIAVRYMMWRTDSLRLKAAIMEPEYRDMMDEYKQAPVLYIDDFLKGGGNPTSADINLAFDLIDYRSARESLVTIISSEYYISELMDIDNAIGGRIFERSRYPQNFCLTIVRDKDNNFRTNPDNFKTHKKPYKEVDIYEV